MSDNLIVTAAHLFDQDADRCGEIDPVDIISLYLPGRTFRAEVIEKHLDTVLLMLIDGEKFPLAVPESDDLPPICKVSPLKSPLQVNFVKPQEVYRISLAQINPYLPIAFLGQLYATKEPFLKLVVQNKIEDSESGGGVVADGGLAGIIRGRQGENIGLVDPVSSLLTVVQKLAVDEDGAELRVGLSSIVEPEGRCDQYTYYSSGLQVTADLYLGGDLYIDATIPDRLEVSAPLVETKLRSLLAGNHQSGSTSDVILSSQETSLAVVAGVKHEQVVVSISNFSGGALEASSLAAELQGIILESSQQLTGLDGVRPDNFLSVDDLVVGEFWAR